MCAMARTTAFSTSTGETDPRGQSFLFAGAWAGAALAHSPNFREEHQPAKNNLENLQKRY